MRRVRSVLALTAALVAVGALTLDGGAGAAPAALRLRVPG
jgi:hypothetical protein